MPGSSAAALLVACCCSLRASAVRLQRAPRLDVAQAVQLGRQAEQALAEGPLRQMGPLALSTRTVAARLPSSKDSKAWGGDKLKAVGVTGTINGGFSAGVFGSAGSDAAKTAHAFYGGGYRGLEGKSGKGLPSAYGIIGVAEVEPGSVETLHAVPSKAGGADFVHTQVKASGGHLTAMELPAWARGPMPKAEQRVPARAASPPPARSEADVAEEAAKQRAAEEGRKVEREAAEEAKKREEVRKFMEARKAEEAARSAKAMAEAKEKAAAEEAAAAQKEAAQKAAAAAAAAAAQKEAAQKEAAEKAAAEKAAAEKAAEAQKEADAAAEEEARKQREVVRRYMEERKAQEEARAREAAEAGRAQAVEASKPAQDQKPGADWLAKVGEAMKNMASTTQAPAAAAAEGSAAGPKKQGDFLRKVVDALSHPPTPKQLEKRKEFFKKLGEKVQPTPEQLEQGKDFLKQLGEKLQPALDKLKEDSSKDLAKKLGEDIFKKLGEKVSAAAPQATAGPDWLKNLQKTFAGSKP